MLGRCLPRALEVGARPSQRIPNDNEKPFPHSHSESKQTSSLQQQEEKNTKPTQEIAAREEALGKTNKIPLTTPAPLPQDRRYYNNQRYHKAESSSFEASALSPSHS